MNIETSKAIIVTFSEQELKILAVIARYGLENIDNSSNEPVAAFKFGNVGFPAGPSFIAHAETIVIGIEEAVFGRKK